ncbi:MAG TPA: hypothetical protein DD638_07055 [Pasteurellaceae bacterium]|nr:hypothetical protein [Pasteurellaceae bacterium]
MIVGQQRGNPLLIKHSKINPILPAMAKISQLNCIKNWSFLPQIGRIANEFLQTEFLRQKAKI